MGSNVVTETNITATGERQRRRIGFVLIAIGVALVAVQMVSGAPKMWRLAAVIPFFAGANFWLQAHKKT